jgi:hypothetical protein
MRIQSTLLASLLGLACSASAAMYWVHPGTLDGKAELDYVKTQIAAGAAPWTSMLTSLGYAEDIDAPPTPETSINANTGGNNSRDDARRAYGNALTWYLTGNENNAKQAIAILNAWSGLQSITATDQQKYLQAGWIGSLFGPAADLMLGYPGWAAADIAKLRAMFVRAFYPNLNIASSWNGNVDLHQISAMMSIAVFNEDETEFNLGLTRLASRMPKYFYLTTDAQPSASLWSNPALWVNGLTQETCRDNNHHAQFGMSGAIGAMETAWHQGVDVYTTYQTRMVATMELMGLQSNSGDMQGVCGTTGTSPEGGLPRNTASSDVYDTWEIGYNHYKTRKNIPMPNTGSMITSKVRSAWNGGGSWSIFYETLTHGDIPLASNSSSISGKPTNYGQLGASVSLHGNGMIEILANQAASYEITTLGINGSQVSQTTINPVAGKSQLVSLGLNGAPAGMYLVQVRTGRGSSLIKYIKP